MSQRKLQLWYFSYKAYLIDLTTFLIFTLDIYTAGTDSHKIFDVYLNANMKLDTIELSTLFDNFPPPLETRLRLRWRCYIEKQFQRRHFHPMGEHHTVLGVWGKGKMLTTVQETLAESRQGKMESPPFSRGLLYLLWNTGWEQARNGDRQSWPLVL